MPHGDASTDILSHESDDSAGVLSEYVLDSSRLGSVRNASNHLLVMAIREVWNRLAGRLLGVVSYKTAHKGLIKGQRVGAIPAKWPYKRPESRGNPSEMRRDACVGS